jgi:hypothetical protein
LGGVHELPRSAAEEQCAMPDDWRPAFVVADPQVRAALDPILVEHRDAIFKQYFRSPMEF